MLTYLRREWGDEAAPIAPDQIAEARKDSGGHEDVQWTAQELLKIT